VNGSTTKLGASYFSAKILPATQSSYLIHVLPYAIEQKGIFMAYSPHGSIFLLLLLSITALSAPLLHARASAPDASITVTVKDSKGQSVPDLNTANFILNQNGKPLSITSVQRIDTPACIGLMLDKSGSMHSKSPMAISSVMGFVRASNPEDKFFVVIFNNKAYIDQDYTNDASKIQKAIAWHEAYGGTALYDTVVASGDHLMKNKDCQRRILIVLTDGGDNMSRKSLSQAVDDLKKMQGLTMRLVMITDREPNIHASRHDLEKLVASVRGEAIFVGLKNLEQTFQRTALELRSEYVITYKPEEPVSDEYLRSLTVNVHAAGHKNLRARIEVADSLDPAAAKQ
jgi:Ca-activated chloride channel family protein